MALSYIEFAAAVSGTTTGFLLRIERYLD